MEGELKRMAIEAYRDPNYSGSPAETFTVSFNPTSYTQKYEVLYDSRQGQGDIGSPQIFGKIKPQEYAFEFLFDGTGTAVDPIDVQQAVDRFLEVTGKQDGDIHRPMYLKLAWGALISKCVLTSAEITYTLFRPDGHPLRARIKANFSENIDDALRVAKERKNSPDLTHVRVVEEGDHLTLMCQRIYGDPSHYIQVAQINSLDNYRELTVGQTIRFPPIRLANT